MRAFLSRPTTRAAAVLIGIAGAVFTWWRLTDADWIDAWMPNVVTGLIAVAVTITFVERIVNREARRRLGPRIERLRDGLRANFAALCESVALDYEGTHLKTYRPIPREVLPFLSQWLEDRDKCDIERSGKAARVPLIIEVGRDLRDALRVFRTDDREIMEPDLVRAIDEYLDRANAALDLYRLAEYVSDDETANEIRRAEEAIVDAAHAFGEALTRWDRGTTLVFPEELIGFLEARRAARTAPRRFGP